MRGASISAGLFFASCMMLLNLFVPLPRLGAQGLHEPPQGKNVFPHVMFVVGGFVLSVVCWYYVDRTPPPPIGHDLLARAKREPQFQYEKPAPQTEALKQEPPVRAPPLRIVECPNCQTRVIPMESGICPSCRRRLVPSDL